MRSGLHMVEVLKVMFKPLLGRVDQSQLLFDDIILNTQGRREVVWPKGCWLSSTSLTATGYPSVHCGVVAQPRGNDGVHDAVFTSDAPNGVKLK